MPVASVAEAMTTAPKPKKNGSRPSTGSGGSRRIASTQFVTATRCAAKIMLSVPVPGRRTSGKIEMHMGRKRTEEKRDRNRDHRCAGSGGDEPEQDHLRRRRPDEDRRKQRCAERETDIVRKAADREHRGGKRHRRKAECLRCASSCPAKISLWQGLAWKGSCGFSQERNSLKPDKAFERQR